MEPAHAAHSFAVMDHCPARIGYRRLYTEARMKRTLALAVICLALVGCDQEKASVTPPPPHRLTPDAIGYFCGMNVLEHSGPKGQIILASRSDPFWFSSA